MSEIFFLVEQAPEGDYTARALDASIFTGAADLESLHLQVRDAVRCHFEEGQTPRFIRLHVTHEEVIAGMRLHDLASEYAVRNDP